MRFFFEIEKITFFCKFLEMTQFQRIINEGKLIDTNYDPDQAKAAFEEILSLFEAHEAKIKKLENIAQTFYTNDQADKLRERIKDLQETHENFVTDITQAMKKQKNESQNNVQSLKEWTEEQCNTLIVDVRRFINQELEGYVPKSEFNLKIENEKPEEPQHPQKPVERNNSDSIFASKIAELQDRIEKIESKQNIFAKSSFVNDELAALKEKSLGIAVCQSKISVLEKNFAKLKAKTDENAQKMQTNQFLMPLEETKMENSSVTNFCRTPSMSIFSVSSLATPIKEVETPKPVTPTLSSIPRTNSCLITPSFADTDELERGIRKLNENYLNLKQSHELLNEREQKLEKLYNTFVSQTGMKNLEISQNIDQLSEQLSRAVQTVIKDPKMKELIAPLQRKMVTIEKRLTEVENRKIPTSSSIISEIEAKKTNDDLIPLPPPQIPTPSDEMDSLKDQGKVQSFSVPTSNVTSFKDIPSTPLIERRDSYELESPPPPLPVSTPLRAKNSETKIKIIRHGDRKTSEQLIAALEQAKAPTITQEEIQEKVDNAIRKTLSGFSDRVKKAVMETVEERLKITTKIQAEIETKIDRSFVERMFNKFRVLIAELKERVDSSLLNFKDWITRDELEEILGRFSTSLQDIKDTAGASSKYRCLLCGRPRTHISGMIVNSPRNEEEDQSERSEKSETRPKTASKVNLKQPKSIRRPLSHAMPRDVVQLITGKEARK